MNYSFMDHLKNTGMCVEFQDSGIIMVYDTHTELSKKVSDMHDVYAILKAKKQYMELMGVSYE